MRVSRLRVAHYGTVSELDTGDEPLGSLVVVCGENEAGKSTIFDALVTLFFGFRPAQRDLHPYAPWSGGDPGIQAEIEFDTGSVGRLTRTLRGRVEGKWEYGHESRDLGNQPLAHAARIGLPVFETIYALSVERLRALDGRSWESVLELLLTGLGTSDLASVQAVIASLETEANALWRPDRRGKPRARGIENEIITLEGQRRHAQERRTRELTLRAQAERLRDEMAASRSTEQARREQVRTLQKLLPILQRTESIREALAVAGDATDWAALPSDPTARRLELDRAILTLEKQIATRQTRCEELLTTVRTFDEVDRFWLEHTAEVDELRNTLGRWVDRERERTNARARRADTESTWRELAEAHSDPHAEPEPWLASIEAGDHAGSPSWWGWVAGIACLSLGLLGWALARGAPTYAWFSGTVLVTTTTLAAALRTRERNRHRRLAEQRARRTTAAHAVISARAQERGIAAEAAALGAQARAIAEALRLTIDEPAGEKTLAVLSERLATAQRHEARAEAALQEHELATRELDALTRDRDALARDRAALNEALERLDPGQPARAAARVVTRRAAAEKAVQLEESLALEFPDLELRRAELEVARRSGTEISPAALEDLLQQSDLERQHHERRLADLQRVDLELAALRAHAPLSEIVGDLERLREELANVRRERDRRHVLAAVLREAERSFRASHQADILERASELLRWISGERYTRLLLADDGVGLDLVDANERRTTRLQSPMSRGLRDQAFFALRLAIADHLDDRRDRLPILIDEALVNWDPVRRARGLDLLAATANHRQVFFFTFDEVPDRFRSARVVQLTRSHDYS
ncbi:MAG: AAA family ATPase [Planctomycetota bacterium]